MSISRRAFLKGLAALAVSAAVPVPAFSSLRAPYITKNSGPVSYIGHCPDPASFIGAKCVHSVGEWDGVGYPVTVLSNSYPTRKEVYYDVDLADFNKEIPPRFWHDPANKKYPNVHTWLRMQRYGESFEQAVSHLNFVTAGK